MPCARADGTATPAGAQTWIYETDSHPRYYEPQSYEPRAYQAEAPALVTGRPLALTPAQRTTIYRTIIPQGRGTIVRERIVSETVVPAVPQYLSMLINNRLLLVDPATSIVVAEVMD
jgi:hypothetical protein